MAAEGEPVTMLGVEGRKLRVASCEADLEDGLEVAAKSESLARTMFSGRLSSARLGGTVGLDDHLGDVGVPLLPPRIEEDTVNCEDEERLTIPYCCCWTADNGSGSSRERRSPFEVTEPEQEEVRELRSS